MYRLIPESRIGLIATICGGLFIGYCIYFDKKRRSDPNYKKKVIERRKLLSEEQERKNRIVIDFNDPVALQRFFIQELELGEDLLRAGDVEEAVEYLCRSITVCPTPDQMIATLQQTIPPPIFIQILQRLPAVSKQIMKGRETQRIRVRPRSPQMVDNLDLE